MKKKNHELMEWFCSDRTGFYQFVGYGEDEQGNEIVLETKLDPSDGRPREVWEKILKKFPEATGYKSFCEAYRDRVAEWDAYCARQERRYKAYWGRRA